MRKKLITAIIALSLVLSCMVGITVAWLFVETDEVTNVFTPSDITLKLDETKNKFQMVPGVDIAKDPKVTVKADFDAYVFVKIVENGTVTVTENNVSTTYTFDDFLSYALADGWTVLEGTYDTNDSNSGNETVVIYRTQAATTAEVTYSVLAGDKVTTNTSVTKQMMNAYTDGSIKLTFTAYAIQQTGFADAEAAWEELNK